MDDLEVVDVAVGLVEVAVGIEVVAIPLVVRGEVPLDLRVGAALRRLARDPHVDRVLDQEPRVAADVGRARNPSLRP
jgi:hypothetical protein